MQEQIELDNRELTNMLHHAGALSGSSLPTVTSYAHYLRQPKSIFRETFRTNFARVLKNILDEKHNALLVVGALLVIVTYQAVPSLPRGGGGGRGRDFGQMIGPMTLHHTKRGQPLV